MTSRIRRPLIISDYVWCRTDALPTREYLSFVIALVCVMAQVRTVQTTLDDIARPPCSRCGAKTWLTRIEPSGDRDRELLTFECPVCEITETKTVKSK
jgi:hypothetical protein